MKLIQGTSTYETCCVHLNAAARCGFWHRRRPSVFIAYTVLSQTVLDENAAYHEIGN